MAWLNSINWIRVAQSDNTATSFESRTVRGRKDVLRYFTQYINGEPQETQKPMTVDMAFERLDRRLVKTRTQITRYESEGIVTGATAIPPASSATGNAETQEYSTTVYDTQRVVNSDGWKVTKEVTSVTIVNGAWETIETTFPEEEEEE